MQRKSLIKFLLIKTTDRRNALETADSIERKIWSDNKKYFGDETFLNQVHSLLSFNLSAELTPNIIPQELMVKVCVDLATLYQDNVRDESFLIQMDNLLIEVRSALAKIYRNYPHDENFNNKINSFLLAFNASCAELAKKFITSKQNENKCNQEDFSTQIDKYLLAFNVFYAKLNKRYLAKQYQDFLHSEDFHHVSSFLFSFNALCAEFSKDFVTSNQKEKACNDLAAFYQCYFISLNEALIVLDEFSQILYYLRNFGLPSYIPLSKIEIAKILSNLRLCCSYGPEFLSHNLNSYEQINFVREFLNYFINDDSVQWNYLDEYIATQIKSNELNDLDLISCTSFELMAILEICEREHVINRFKALSLENKLNFIHLHEVILQYYDTTFYFLIFKKMPARSLYTEFLSIANDQAKAIVQSQATEFPGQITFPIVDGTPKATLDSINRCIRVDDFINHINSFLDEPLQSNGFTFKRAMSLLEKISEKTSKEHLNTLLQKLVKLYKQERQEGYINPKNKHEYRHNRWLSKLFGGYSKTEKIDAATAFENLLSKNEPIPADKLGPLNQGDLGKIWRFYQDNIMEVNAQKVLLQSLWL